MSTDGGGWMLTYAYNHVGGENNALVEGTFPTDPETGYSHAHLGAAPIIGFDQSTYKETRFFCTGAYTGRVMHFKTDNSFQVGVAFSGSTIGNTVAEWTTGYTLLDAHSASLPATIDRVWAGGSNGFWNFPLYDWGSSHWAIRGNGNRWECDDHPDDAIGYLYDTQHLVYVRAACPAGTATSTTSGARR